MFTNHIYVIDMYNLDLTLDNLQWLMCHKTKPILNQFVKHNQTKPIFNQYHRVYQLKLDFLIIIQIAYTIIEKDALCLYTEYKLHVDHTYSLYTMM